MVAQESSEVGGVHEAEDLDPPSRVPFGVLSRTSAPLDLARSENSRNLVFTDAGWSSSVARWAHNPEVAGSNPAPATEKWPLTCRNAGQRPLVF